MKIIINTSNLSVGGGLQVALSFINELRCMEFENDYYIFLSKSVHRQINQNLFPSNFKFYLIENSPSSLLYRSKVVKFLNKLEFQIKV